MPISQVSCFPRLDLFRLLHQVFRLLHQYCSRPSTPMATLPLTLRPGSTPLTATFSCCLPPRPRVVSFRSRHPYSARMPLVAGLQGARKCFRTVTERITPSVATSLEALGASGLVCQNPPRSCYSELASRV